MSTPSETEIFQQILGHLKSIPLLERLTEAELAKIYNICNFQKLEADELMYRFGTPSDSLFVLLDGRLVARSPTGADLAYIPPIGLVGEMGVLTDEPRSADVVAMDPSMGFQITKEDLINLFLEDGAICRKILLNLVKNLSQKLYDTNAEIEKLRKEQEQQAAGGQKAGENIFLY